MSRESSGARVKRADFVLGAAQLNQLPDSGLPEVAVIGRSNVGKSTLINRLTGRKQLARTSAKPGRTQELNCFRITLELGGGDKELMLVDLPGFGFAKFSKEQREALSRLTVDYLTRRSELRAVCLLNDSKRPPEREELALQQRLFDAEVPLIVVVTKLDRLNQGERLRSVKSISAAYGLEETDVVLAGMKTSPVLLWERIAAAASLG